MFKTWGMLKLLRDNWEGPIVLKGIQSVEDALLAMENGMDGIVVSNHGAFDVSLVCLGFGFPCILGGVVLQGYGSIHKRSTDMHFYFILLSFQRRDGVWHGR